MKRVRVILLCDVPSLGRRGDVCAVAAGFAAHKLFPTKRAAPYSAQLVHAFAEEAQRATTAQRALREQRELLRKRIEATMLTIQQACNERGVLYGSVQESTILAALRTAGIGSLEGGTLVLERKITAPGDYTVPVQFPGGQHAVLRLRVHAA